MTEVLNGPHRFKVVRLRIVRAEIPKCSQRQFADLLAANGLPGFSDWRLSRLELGYADVSRPELEALANILKVRAEWLAGLEDAREPSEPVVQVPAANPAEIATEVPPPAPSAPPAIPSRLPERGGVSDLIYHRVLCAEWQRAEEELGKPGLAATAWVSWREYQRVVKAGLGELHL